MLFYRKVGISTGHNIVKKTEVLDTIVIILLSSPAPIAIRGLVEV